MEKRLLGRVGPVLHTERRTGRESEKSTGRSMRGHRPSRRPEVRRGLQHPVPAEERHALLHRSKGKHVLPSHRHQLGEMTHGERLNPLPDDNYAFFSQKEGIPSKKSK